MPKNRIETFVCPTCFVEFMVSFEVAATMRRKGKPFHCLNGHEMFFEPSRESYEALHRRVIELEELLEAERVTRAEIEGHMVQLRHRAEQAEAEAENARARAFQLQRTLPHPKRKAAAPTDRAAPALPFPAESGSSRKD